MMMAKTIATTVIDTCMAMFDFLGETAREKMHYCIGKIQQNTQHRDISSRTSGGVVLNS